MTKHHLGIKIKCTTILKTSKLWAIKVSYKFIHKTGKLRWFARFVLLRCTIYLNLRNFAGFMTSNWFF